MTAPDSRDSVVEDLQALTALAERATPGEWMLATSCSWRRILTITGNRVIVPITQQSDGHPDLNCGAEYINAEVAIAAVNFIRAHGHEVLQALARGPQQAGGEDVGAAVERLRKNARNAFNASSDADTVIAAFGALQAEVARYKENDRLQMERAIRAEATLREAGRDAERYRWLRRKIDPDTIDAVIEDDFDLRESQSRDVDAAIDAARLVRDGDSGEGE